MSVINLCIDVVIILILVLIHRPAADLQTMNDQSKIYSVMPQEKKAENNYTLSINKLKRIFDPANCSDGWTICKTLNPNDVSDYLTKEVKRNVKRLCLILRSAKSFSEWKKRKINLDSLNLLTSLTWLQIMPQKGSFITHNRVEIAFPGNHSHKLPLEELHITIPLLEIGLVPFLKSLINLKVLNLGDTMELNIDGQFVDIINTLQGKQLIALSLRAFQTLMHYQPNFIEILNVTKFLWPLRQCPLQYLDLSHNDFLETFPGISSVAKNLRILDVSKNNLLDEKNTFLLEYLMHPTLEIIYFSNQGSSDKFQNEMGQVNSIRHKRTQVGDVNSIMGNYEICKRDLAINDTQEKEKHHFCELLQCLAPNTFKDIPCAVLPSWSDIFPLNFSCRYSLKIPIAKNLKEIHAANWNGFTIPKGTTEKNSLCLGPNSVQKIILSSNSKLFKGIYFQQNIKDAYIFGMEQVTYLDLSDNELLVPLENEWFYSFPQLQYLYLSGNFMNISNSDICRSNKHLKVLDLRRNGLNTIIDFRGCNYLEELDVSQNKLTSLSFDLKNIRFLNASDNKITKLSEKTIHMLKNLESPVTLDLSSNLWDCGCSKESIQSVKFMQTASEYNITFLNFIHYQCYSFGSYSFLSKVQVSHLTDQCYPSNIHIYIQAVAITISFVLVILLFYSCYRCRYRINTCYFHTCQRIHRNKNKRVKLNTCNIKYDAFVSYASDDRFWVHDVLMPELEKNYGLKLCLHYRDFPAHGDIADVIVEKINQSNSIVVVLSRFSVVRPWCDFELKQAHAQHLYTGQDLIIIKLGEIPSDLRLTDLVQDLLNSQVYIEWPEIGAQPSESDRRRQYLFWSKIQRAIYGQDHCECFRYCNPLYKRNDPLRIPLQQNMEENPMTSAFSGEGEHYNDLNQQ